MRTHGLDLRPRRAAEHRLLQRVAQIEIFEIGEIDVADARDIRFP